MLLRPLPIVTLVRPQYSNASLPMLATLFGIVMLVRGQLQNAEYPM